MAWSDAGKCPRCGGRLQSRPVAPWFSGDPNQYPKPKGYKLIMCSSCGYEGRQG